MDLMMLERKALTLEFIQDGRNVVAVVRQWLEWLNDGRTGVERFERLCESLKRIDESIDLAAVSCHVARRYLDDIAKGRAPSFADALEALNRIDGQMALYDWQQGTERYLQFLIDFIETPKRRGTTDSKEGDEFAVWAPRSKWWKEFSVAGHGDRSWCKERVEDWIKNGVMKCDPLAPEKGQVTFCRSFLKAMNVKAPKG